jgi:hypothetical protein
MKWYAIFEHFLKKSSYYFKLETAMNETKLFYGQRLPADIEWSRKDGMMCKGASVQQINEKAEFHFVLEYRYFSL